MPFLFPLRITARPHLKLPVYHDFAIRTNNSDGADLFGHVLIFYEDEVNTDLAATTTDLETITTDLETTDSETPASFETPASS